MPPHSRARAVGFGYHVAIFHGNISHVTGVTTKQLQKKLPAGFDKKIWAENPTINNGFPYLIANPPVQ